MTPRLRVLALAGGVGGAKLAAGLAQIFGERLTILVNTGDDFEHLGLHISPDPDTVMYTLAGIANSVTGWGRARIAGCKCPRSVEIRAEPLPLSGANKIDKPALRAPYWAKEQSQPV